MAEPMTPWDHIREAEHIEAAKVKHLMAEPGAVAAAVNAPRTVGRVSLYPMDLP